MPEPKFGVQDPERERITAAQQARLDQEARDARTRAELLKAETKRLKWKTWAMIIGALFNTALLLLSLFLLAEPLTKMLNGDVTFPTVWSFVFWLALTIINLRPHLTAPTKKD